MILFGGGGGGDTSNSMTVSSPIRKQTNAGNRKRIYSPTTSQSHHHHSAFSRLLISLVHHVKTPLMILLFVAVPLSLYPISFSTNYNATILYNQIGQLPPLRHNKLASLSKSDWTIPSIKQQQQEHKEQQSSLPKEDRNQHNNSSSSNSNNQNGHHYQHLQQKEEPHQQVSSFWSITNNNRNDHHDKALLATESGTKSGANRKLRANTDKEVGERIHKEKEDDKTDEKEVLGTVTVPLLDKKAAATDQGLGRHASSSSYKHISKDNSSSNHDYSNTGNDEEAKVAAAQDQQESKSDLLYYENGTAKSHSKITNEMQELSYATLPSENKVKENEYQLASFSSCLLVMDENHRLPEWLAYHYYMLPVRHVVIMVDPHSKTSPLSIAQRWSPYVQIELWNDTAIDFYPRKSEDPEDRKNQHRKRQRLFYKQCALHFQKLGKYFVTFHDVDEFMYLDKGHILNAAERMNEPGSILRVLQELKNATSMNLPCQAPILQDNPAPERLLDYARVGFDNYCFIMSRVLFSGMESPAAFVEKDVPRYLNATRFETLRWMRRTSFGDVAHNGIGKSLLDVSDQDADLKFLTDGGIHRVLETCPMTKFRFSPIRIRHYLGSWEYYTSRDDGRRRIVRSREMYEYRSGHTGEFPDMKLDDDVRPWLQGFCRVMGHNRTLIEHLLMGLGQLPPRPQQYPVDHWSILPEQIEAEIYEHYEEGEENFASWLKARFTVKKLENGTYIASRQEPVAVAVESKKTEKIK